VNDFDVSRENSEERVHLISTSVSIDLGKVDQCRKKCPLPTIPKDIKLVAMPCRVSTHAHFLLSRSLLSISLLGELSLGLSELSHREAAAAFSGLSTAE